MVVNKKRPVEIWYRFPVEISIIYKKATTGALSYENYQLRLIKIWRHMR